VDGNIERVIARLFALATPLPRVKPELRRLAAALAPARRCGDYTQALMDLGATVCTPRAPKCAICPIARPCAARAAGIAEDLPRRAPKPARPVRHGVAFWTVAPDGAVLLRRRPARGLLGGMMEVPSTEWRAEPWLVKEAAAQAPTRAKWRALPGTVRHGFTHFELELTVLVGRATKGRGAWWPVDRLAEAGLPSAMRKIVRHVLAKG
jgi:A/G-specific adenine glycosylase